MRKYGLDMSAIALSVCTLLPLLGNMAGDTAFEEVQALTMGYDPTVAGKVYGIRGKRTSSNPASWTLLLKELNSWAWTKKARENTSVQAAKQQVGLHRVNYRLGRSGGNEVV